MQYFPHIGLSCLTLEVSSMGIIASTYAIDVQPRGAKQAALMFVVVSTSMACMQPSHDTFLTALGHGYIFCFFE